MQAPKALASLRICADSPEPSLLDNVISTKIACAGSLIIDSVIMIVDWNITYKKSDQTLNLFSAEKRHVFAFVKILQT